MKLALCLFIAVIALGGCAAAPVDSAVALADWTRGQGGEITDARLARLTDIGNGLPHPASAAPLTFHVLNSTSITAYSWDSGDIFLSAGLIDRATDDEIAAALAHEMGHLINAGNASRMGAAGLRGGNKSLLVEERADAEGVAVLQKTGRPPAALISLLTKVRAASASAVSKEEIQQRIVLLRNLLAM